MTQPRKINPASDEQLQAPQPVKFGAWSSDDMTGQFYYLAPGQELSPHKVLASDLFYVVLAGNGTLSSFAADAFPDDKVYRPHPLQKVVPPAKTENLTNRKDQSIAMSGGDVFVVPRDTFYSIESAQEEELVLFCSSAADAHESVFTSR